MKTLISVAPNINTKWFSSPSTIGFRTEGKGDKCVVGLFNDTVEVSVCLSVDVTCRGM